MGLRKKGTRRIVVNQWVFRWTVAPDDEPGLGLVVELYVTPGQRLVVWFEHGTIIAPGLVRESILQALEQGWTPDQTGPLLVFRCPDFNLLKSIEGLSQSSSRP